MWGLQRSFYPLVLFSFSSAYCAAQAAGVVTGVVTDPSGARIAKAAVHLEQAPGAGRDVQTDDAGRFTVSLPAGRYDITISADTFTDQTRKAVTVADGARVEVNFSLKVQATAEEVNVPSDSAVGTGGADNKSALVFEGDKLAALSDDDAILQKQVLALAGTDGIHTPQIYIDGFTGGKFPPKGSIRQIKINENPYTAQYDQLGFGRVEILTKPGTGDFHGALSANGNNAPFNAQNPYTPFQPPYHTLYLDGNLSGPLGKKTSVFAAGTYFDQASNAVVNTIFVSEAVRNPSTNSTFSVRLDHQLSTNNTFTGRYEYNQVRQTNGGVGLLVLPSEGFNNTTTMQTLQLSNTQIVNPKVVNETRFQYIRTRLRQTVADGSPTVIVQGAFNGGGSSAGNLNDAQDRYEFQDYLSIEKGKQLFRVGGRYRLLRDANLSTANYNGTFIFPDVASYNAAQAGAEGGASLYSVTSGQAVAKVLTGDLGLYAEDEWKAGKNVTVDGGLRFETQNAIPDHANWAPRVGVSWAIHQVGTKPAFLVLRVGGGLFYDRFDASNILTSIRQNGLSQRTYVVQDPQFYRNIPAPSALGTAQPATTYSISPRLKVQDSFIAGLSADHTFGKYGSMSVGFFHIQGRHQYLSRNINAPLPGTFVPGDPTSGVRPFGNTQGIYQFASDGTSNSTFAFTNANFNLNKHVSFFGFYAIPRQRSDTNGATAFPTNEYDLHVDYGRSSFDRQQYYLSTNLRMPYGISVSPSVFGNSAAPFDITIGQDLNGDSQYNERPTFATDLTRTSVRRTPWGNFDTAPIAGQKTIPLNYGHGYAMVTTQLQVSKDFKLGPRPSAAKIAADLAANGAPAPPPPPPGTPAAKPDRPYTLSFSIEGSNVLNAVNPGPPVGVLSSPLFGKVISLNGGFSSNAAANRTITLRSSFNF